LIGPLQKKNIETLKAPQIEASILKIKNIKCLPFGPSMQDNFGQSIRDKNNVLLGTSWGTNWDLLRTPWEHKTTKNANTLYSHSTKEKKKPGPLDCILHHLIG